MCVPASFNVNYKHITKRGQLEFCMLHLNCVLCVAFKAHSVCIAVKGDLEFVSGLKDAL